MRNARSTLLVVIWSVGCVSFRLDEVEATGAHLSVALPPTDSEYLIVRVDNPEPDPLYLDWSSAHFRGPDGFEFPAEVRPESRLSVIYGGGRVEYHVYPAHVYAPPDRAGWRRNSLSRDLIPRESFFLSRRPYTLSFFIRVCQGAQAACAAAAPHSDGGCSSSHCRLAVVTATVARL